MDIEQGYSGLLFRRLTEEHQRILAALDLMIDSDDPDPETRRAAFERLARAIRIQSAAEEAIVFPVLDGSFELGHHVREDQARMRGIEARLRKIERSDEIDAAQLLVLRSMLVREYDDEEQVVFPRALMVMDSTVDTMLLEYEQERAFLEGRM